MKLTDRELKVMDLVAQGKSSAQIARAITSTKMAVDSNVKAVLKKYGAANRAHAAVLYVVSRRRCDAKTEAQQAIRRMKNER